MNAIAAVHSFADSNFSLSLDRLMRLIRIPSVSADPARAPDVERAAAWLVEELVGLGFQAEVRPTGGLPMVVAHHQGPGPDAPHILYYGHYDVQPAEPLDLWTSPPFEPVVVEAEHGPRLLGRGAADDKGQLMTFIEAFRAWIAATGGLPVRVTVILEGEEESGSPSLVPFLEANRKELTADVCVITDTNALDRKTPAITTRLRGLVYEEVSVRGPSRDLHSGLFGGVALNPLNVLARVFGALHDDAGHVAIPGFYDGVADPSPEERAMWARLPMTAEAMLGGVGLPADAAAGEADRSFIERLWSRPTCDINGLKGGHIEAGAKTVIPAEAVGKVSFRLVPGQDPDRVVAGFRQFVRDRLPAGAVAAFRSFGASPAYVVSPDQPFLRAAMGGLAEVCPNPPVLIGSGASIPVAFHIKTLLGFDSLLVGFGLDDDRIHSPNEKFEVGAYRDGIHGHIAMLARFAEVAVRHPLP